MSSHSKAKKSQERSMIDFSRELKRTRLDESTTSLVPKLGAPLKKVKARKNTKVSSEDDTTRKCI